MSSVSSSSSHPGLLCSSFYGILRGVAVTTLIYPLEVIKIHQQCLTNSKTSMQVARYVFQQEGAQAFYRGLAPKLLKTTLKQAWVWPIITEAPHLLTAYQLGKNQKLILTGFFIASLDAAVTTPLEKTKIFLSLKRKTPFSLSTIYKDGWKGFTVYWTKKSVNIITFLISQQYLREKSRQQKKDLKISDLIKIGIKISVIVGFVSAPLDLAHTLKQAHSLRLRPFFCRKNFFRLYRGWPINTLALAIHNVASVIVIEKLTKQTPNTKKNSHCV